MMVMISKEEGVSNSGKTYTNFGENVSALEVLEDPLQTLSSKNNNERVESNEDLPNGQRFILC